MINPSFSQVTVFYYGPTHVKLHSLPEDPPTSLIQILSLSGFLFTETSWVFFVHFPRKGKMSSLGTSKGVLEIAKFAVYVTVSIGMMYFSSPTTPTISRSSWAIILTLSTHRRHRDLHRQRK